MSREGTEPLSSDPDTGPPSTVSTGEHTGAFEHLGFAREDPQWAGYATYSFNPGFAQQQDPSLGASPPGIASMTNANFPASERFAPFTQDPMSWGQQQQQTQQQRSVYGTGQSFDVSSAAQQPPQAAPSSFMTLPQREQRQQYIDPQTLNVPMGMQMGHPFAPGSQNVGWGWEQDPRLGHSSTSSPAPSQQGFDLGRSGSQASHGYDRRPSARESREQAQPSEGQNAAYIKIERPTRAMLNDVRDVILRHNGRASFQAPEM